ncbi:ADP-heptose--lipooligosaccharide heptosyltransferase II [Olavius algarvensis associated proteobacterium Delta 3]|nr:ADP-heptose--lipooligosaccharide heptosyltransferase II [Olavius algarvensis associated proteobacterium Delta 3]CAB5084890.1 ADP-heptose--lipooligosaccharide heptosyltransferase II [Olavius algarvensis associated proteobacterium Delta 3]
MKLSEKRNIRRLLIRSTNWIGDAVMTTPALRAIRMNFPGVHIGLLAKPWVMPLFDHCPHIDARIPYDAAGRHRGWMGKLRLAKDLRRYQFDAAILLQNAFEAALITWLAGIPLRIGFDSDGRRLLLTHPVRRTPAVRKVHQTHYYMEILTGTGLWTDSANLELFTGREDAVLAESLLRKHGVRPGDRLVGLNASAAYGPAKQWPTDRFARLADKLQDAYGVKLVLFGGPGDKDLGRVLTSRMEGTAIDFCGQTRLGEAIALIQRCDLFITNDSGLMHVAAALNVPLIAIFGSTDPVATGPASTNGRVVRVPIDCSPCLKPECPLGHLNCMNLITVDMVFEATREFL